MNLQPDESQILGEEKINENHIHYKHAIKIHAWNL
jgi:hypothetical protein